MRGATATVWYLSGLIGSGEVLEKCAAWRNLLKEMRSAYLYIDPLSGENHSEITDDGLKGTFDPKAIVHRDKASVRNSDGLVVCLDTFGSPRGLCGTIFELAWAMDWGRPVVAFSEEMQPKYVSHPFISAACTVIVPTIEEAAKYMDFLARGM